MNLESAKQVEATRTKLRILENRHEAVRNKAMTNELVRELTLRSLRQTINQFKEEIIRFESGATRSRNYGDLDVTRKKLQLLEERYEAVRQKTPENEYVRELTLQSLKGSINQLKEEIVWAKSRSAAGARGS
jgi:hypothetical protein